MNFKDLFLSAKGRIPRSRYWVGLAIIFLAGIIAGMVLVPEAQQITTTETINGEIQTSYTQTQEEGGLLLALVNLALAVFSILIAIKRFHDMEKSGWFSILVLVPIVNIAVMFFWLGMVKGTDGANKYGPDPLLSSPTDLTSTEV